ncbi:MAG: hypothetical protein V4550_01865 [Gemmatimonadota bacterium]
MECLLVTVRAHPLSVRETYQLVFCAQAVDGTHQLGHALELYPVLRLTESDARWCEVEYGPIKKGAARRDQRDE